MNEDGSVKVRCKYYNIRKSKSRGYRICDINNSGKKIFDCDGNDGYGDVLFKLCDSISTIPWTKYLIYKQHLIEVK